MYNWLKREQGGLLGGRIKWNFTKSLVGRDGGVIARYAPTHAPVYSAIGHDFTAALMMEITDALSAQDLAVEQAINEYGAGTKL